MLWGTKPQTRFFPRVSLCPDVYREENGGPDVKRQSVRENGPEIMRGPYKSLHSVIQSLQATTGSISHPAYILQEVEDGVVRYFII